MKIVKNELTILIVLFVICLYGKTLAIAAENANTVKVIGSSWINGLTENAALILAKSEAKRRALERAGKTFVSSATKTRNMLLVSDVVLTRSTGLLTNFKWGRHWIENGKIYVELTVDVLTEALNYDFLSIEKILHEIGMPRVGILIKAEIGSVNGKELTDVKPYLFFSEAFLGGLKLYFIKITPDMDIKYLSPDEKNDADNFARIFNSSARDNAFNQSRLSIELRSDAKTETELKAVKAASNEFGVDIVVSGNIRITVDEKKISGLDTVTYTISPHIEVIQAATNKILAVIEDSFSTKPLSLHDSQKQVLKALKRIGLRSGRELMGQLLSHWTTDKQSIQIIIKNSDIDKVTEVEKVLSTIGGDQKFVLRSMSSGIANIEFYSDMNGDELLRFLQEQEEVDITVNSVLEGKLIIEVDNGWF